MGKDLFEPFHAVLADIGGSIRRHAQNSGRPVIGVMPAYFPLELAHAAGGYPVQLWGTQLPVGRADAYLQSYCCSVARSLLELELRGSARIVSAYVFTSLCDTLVNLRELYRRLFKTPTFEFAIPVTAGEAARREYLSSLIPRLLRGLEAVTGGKATGDRLAASARAFGRVRSLQRELYRLRRDRAGFIRCLDFYAAIKTGFYLPVEEYTRMLERLLEDLRRAPPARQGGGRRPGILLSGMVFDPLAALAVFDEIGVEVVDDDMAAGWRSVSRPTLHTDDLTEGVVAHLFGAAPCCCLYHPGHDRHGYLVEKARASGADGVLFWYVKFCEPDAFDRPQLLARLGQEGLAAAVVEVDVSMTGFDALKTRLQAFCEMLGG
jgi:benzoyl-CoA reductase subunit C